MQQRPALPLALLLALILVAACGGPSPSGPPVTGAPPSVPPSTAAASSPTSSSPASPDAQDARDAILGVVGSMAAAVRAGDRAAYLALVDLTDPVFALEHTRLADDWSTRNPVAAYDLELAGLEIDGAGATGRLTVTWQLPDGEGPRTAAFEVRFTNEAGAWRYAGEVWTPTEVPHFRILVAPGLDGSVPAIVDDLPSVYDDVTAALGHVPAGTMELKLYTDSEALVANTLLSLPPILGWNEPGEALKLRLRDDGALLTPVIAHEFVHFLSFDRAGTQRTRMPWWLDEGIAGFIAEAFEGPVLGDRLDQVVAWHENGELADWRDMAVFEETPQSLWRFVYPQGYAMVRYVTERYGESGRNAWLASMATEMTIDEATPAAFDLSFAELDAGFRQWLATAAR